MISQIVVNTANKLLKPNANENENKKWEVVARMRRRMGLARYCAAKAKGPAESRPDCLRTGQSRKWRKMEIDLDRVT